MMVVCREGVVLKGLGSSKRLLGRRAVGWWSLGLVVVIPPHEVKG